MNGAESLLSTLVAGGVEVCFANPGTSEMHFVAALDRTEGMRCVLALFEGVVTGAADGYARMADKPACTLLHLGPGLGNGLANLHNASRANSPIINIVGDHATYHKAYDAPLNSDVEAIARPYSPWLRTSASAAAAARDGAEAIAAARSAGGQIATLILPADTAWNDGTGVAAVPALPPETEVSSSAIDRAVRMLRSGEPAAILLGHTALREGALATAGRIAAATGCQLLAPYSMARLERGAGRVAIDRIPYPIDQAIDRLRALKRLVIIGSTPPVAFFAYPGKPNVPTQEDCDIHVLATPGDDLAGALETLADALSAHAPPMLQALDRPALPTGNLSLTAIGAAIGALMPENAIVVDESITSGRGLLPMTAGAAPHAWLANTGGSIGIALPMAVGAAIACPDRRVLCLEGDGSGMYTLQALWTMAREKLDITTIVFANRSYAILKGELANVGAGNPGRRALDMLDIGRPDLDWVGLAQSMGVAAARATTADELVAQLSASLVTRGPRLIELVL